MLALDNSGITTINNMMSMLEDTIQSLMYTVKVNGDSVNELLQMGNKGQISAFQAYAFLPKQFYHKL